MYWRLDKFLVETTVQFIRRIFRYNSTWTNTNLEIVQFTSGSEQLAFEQYFEEAERYPFISVGSNGGAFTRAGFNDFITSGFDDSFILGSRAQSSVTISDTSIVASQLPSAADNLTARGVLTYLAWAGDRVGGDPITVNLYKDYTTTPVLVASGSIFGNTDTNFDSYYTDLYPQTALTENDYWLTYQTQSGSTYYIGIDTDITNTTYTYNSVTTTGSVTADLVLPAFVRIGGNYEPSLSIRVSAKNDTKTVYDLSELIVQYFVLAKHGQVSRQSDATNGLQNIFIDEDSNVEWTQHGFFIKDIRKGAMEIRRRGENDIIFSTVISIDIFTEWFQDYDAITAKDMELTIYSYFNGREQI